MTLLTNEPDKSLPWKNYLITIAEAFFAFYIATFSLLVFFLHHGEHWLFPALLMVSLFLFVVFACIKLVVKTFSFAAIMLIIPIAPLIALIVVVSLIPVIEKLM